MTSSRARRIPGSARRSGRESLFGGTGTDELAAVYIELDPGKQLGRHTDSPEEVLLVLDGAIEVSIGEESARAGRGALVVV